MQQEKVMEWQDNDGDRRFVFAEVRMRRTKGTDSVHAALFERMSALGVKIKPHNRKRRVNRGPELSNGCFGCKLKKLNRQIGAVAVGLDDAKQLEKDAECKLLCKACQHSLDRMEEYKRDFQLGLRDEPEYIQDMYRQYPPWAKFRLLGVPDSAVRVLSIYHGLEQNVIDHYWRDSESTDNNNADDQAIDRTVQQLENWRNRYNLFVVNTLIETHEASFARIAGKLILEYVDPNIFYLCVVRLDDKFTKQESKEFTGLNVIPRIALDKIEQIQGWSEPAIRQLNMLSKEQAFLFSCPIGFLHMREQIAQFLNKPTPPSFPLHQ